MAFSEVEICNRALQMLGAQAITSLSENSKNSRECNRCYNSLRQSLLRAHPWNFATVFASLPQLSNPPNPPPINSLWANTYTYNLPVDFLRLIAVSGFISGWLWEGISFTWAQDYIIQNSTIITWVTPPLNIRYLQDFSDTTKMDPLFRESLSAYMAQEMCEMLTQSNTKGQKMSQAFAASLSEAKKANAFDKPAQDLPTDSYISVRL